MATNSNFTATYSPDDNKLRLYPVSRLPKDLYDQVRAAGFIWAPKQELFVAPAWSPEREDLLIELAGEIDDEDTSLVDRAEDRAERFEGYSERRAADAERANAAVEEIAGAIPLGQPILCGHHSEKHARKHAEKIQSGMQKAVKAWKTSRYWISRAQGAVSAAKYKETPAVRHRRIKTIEADIRRCKSYYTPADEPPHYIMQTASGDTEPSQHVWAGAKGRGGRWVQVSRLPAIEAHYARWIEHYENRLAYEKEILGQQGGIASDKFDIVKGGQVLNRHGEWCVVLRVNKSGGEITSLTTTQRFYGRVKIEDVKDYRPPTEDLAAKVAAVTKLPPMCNYPGEAVGFKRMRHDDSDQAPLGFHKLTRAEWDRIHKDYKGSRIVEATASAVRHRVRTAMVRHALVPVFLIDQKEIWPLKPSEVESQPAPTVTVKDLPIEHDMPTLQKQAAARAEFRKECEHDSKFDNLEKSLKAGVKTASAPQLFPTPEKLAKRIVELADIGPNDDLLEPSAGTGSLLEACFRVNGKNFDGQPTAGRIIAVEINCGLAASLRDRFPEVDVHCGDFLGEMSSLLIKKFDRIVMNPPFAPQAADIKHVKHAISKLKPGGRLVAICANGPRQQEQLKPLADRWYDLPAGSFSTSGTEVNCAIFVYNAP